MRYFIVILIFFFNIHPELSSQNLFNSASKHNSNICEPHNFKLNYIIEVPKLNFFEKNFTNIFSEFKESSILLFDDFFNSTQSIEPIRFYYVQVGSSRTKGFYIENIGNVSYTINRIYYQNGGKGVFNYISNPPTPVTIIPKQAIYVSLIFQPNKVGSFFDTLIMEFTEPFNFNYFVPVEGVSELKIKIEIPDTNGIVGTDNFSVPIYLVGDSNLVEPATANISFSITTNAKVFLIKSISNAKILSSSIMNSYITYNIFIDNLTIDSRSKPICYLIGRIHLSEEDTTQLTISNFSVDNPAIMISSKNGTLELLGFCASDLSIINLDENFVNFYIESNPVKEIIKIRTETTEKNKKQTAQIYLTNILGEIIYSNMHSIENLVEIPIPQISSGIYQLVIVRETQKYSYLLRVLK